MSVNGVTSFQLLAFVVLGVSFALTVVLTVRRRIAPRVGFSWGLLWIAAAIAIARPGLTVIVARFLGIDRGTDLVLYLAILGMFFGFFFVYLRLRRLDSDLTRVVRAVAIQSAIEARGPDARPEDSGADDHRDRDGTTQTSTPAPR